MPAATSSSPCPLGPSAWTWQARTLPGNSGGSLRNRAAGARQGGPPGETRAGRAPPCPARSLPLTSGPRPTAARTPACRPHGPLAAVLVPEVGFHRAALRELGGGGRSSSAPPAHPRAHHGNCGQAAALPPAGEFREQVPGPGWGRRPPVPGPLVGHLRTGVPAGAAFKGFARNRFPSPREGCPGSQGPQRPLPRQYWASPAGPARHGHSPACSALRTLELALGERHTGFHPQLSPACSVPLGGSLTLGTSCTSSVKWSLGLPTLASQGFQDDSGTVGGPGAEEEGDSRIHNGAPTVCWGLSRHFESRNRPHIRA